MLNLMEKMKLKMMLKDCDFELAEEIIREKYDIKNASYEVSERVEDFLLNPCYKTAKKLIDADPIFTFYFKECSGNGLYVRKYRSQDQLSTFEDNSTQQTDEGMDEFSTAPYPIPAVLKKEMQANDEGERKSELPSEPETGATSEVVLSTSRENKSNQDSKLSIHMTSSEDYSAAALQSNVSFDNVISTLQKDMEKLVEEIERTEKEMEDDFAKRLEGEKWLAVCKQALYEFQEAVRILEKAGKRNS